MGVGARRFVGQPAMKGELCRLGECAKKYQNQGRRVEGVGFNRRTGKENIAQGEAADDMPQQQKARE